MQYHLTPPPECNCGQSLELKWKVRELENLAEHYKDQYEDMLLHYVTVKIQLEKREASDA
tara:strand:+ start:463 stop:642 length:180 start_codon:yes stop_codon:yes gene_type:complete